MDGPWKILTAIRYTCPALTLLYFVVASTFSVCTLQTVSQKAKDQHVRRDIILWLMLGVLCEYIMQALLFLIRSFIQTGWFASQDELVYLLSFSLVWGIQFLALMDSKFPVWYTYYVSWTITLLVDLVLLVSSAVLHKPVELFDFISISVQSLRSCSLFALPCLYLALRNRQEVYDSEDIEHQPLLGAKLNPGPSSSGESVQSANKYGGTTDSSSKGSGRREEEEDSWLKMKREDAERLSKRLKNEGNWWAYAKAFTIFIPYLWPVHSKALQFRALLVGLCLLSSNSLNVLVPRQLGAVTDALVAGNNTKAWIEVSIYAALTFANSVACIGWLRFWLWQPLEQYSYDALNTAAHGHVMNLSSDFHETKEPAYIHQAVFQGGSITGLVDTFFFQLLPMFIDLFLVFVYLYYLFGAYMALTLATTTLFYLYTTAKLVSMASARRREYVTYYRKEWYSSYNSVGNWRVASYFNNIPYEQNQHSMNIKARLKSDKSYRMAVKVVSVAQGLIMTLGLLGACFLAVYQVMNKIRSPGDFVILLSYWAQLRGPLSFFSGVYKDISEGMMDAERMLDIFQTKPSIADKKDAKALTFVNGEIKFNNVDFAYDDRKEILKGINIKIAGGSTVAIVGETGSGKSTILKLLHRFYDVKSGSVEVDGQDIRNITLKSLREKIAVVPQDPTLFNDTIMNNVRYAKLDASDDEVYEACKSAAIHNKIMSFPDGYYTKIGKGGIKLSGGEQQRVAISRAILKQSRIILLDEATSAVDTETEQLIQRAFRGLCHGRTTLVVAHRLSTIMRADRILVMKDGCIIEDGSHDDLIRLGGKYHDLWAKQILSTHTMKPLESGSRSPHKDKVDIVNDLELESNGLTHSKTEETAEGFRGRGHAVAEGSRAPKDAPKLKPDAQEFYPRHLRAHSEATCYPAKNETKQEMKNRFKKESDQKQQETEERKSYMALTQKAPKNARKQFEQLSDDEEMGDYDHQFANVVAFGTSQDSTTISNIDDKEGEAKIRCLRFNNSRHQAQIESIGRMKESIDDINDLEDPSSGESQSLLGSGQMSRLSASSNQFTGQQDVRGPSIGVRSRRSRHWRTKNRPADNSGSSTAKLSEISNGDSDQPESSTTSSSEGFQSAGKGFVHGSE